MSQARAAEPPVTIAAFDAFVAAQPDGCTVWELIDGEVVGMTNPNVAHGRIALNIALALGPVATAQGCTVNVGGLRVQASGDLDGVDKTVPDITVHCGGLADGVTWIDNPTVVVEILSPSTMDHDRGQKLHFYKSLAALRDIVIVYQDEVRLEHYVRAGEEWRMTAWTVLDSQLSLTGLPASIPLAAIYSQTSLSQVLRP